MVQINHCEDLEKLILKMGFLPFFNIGIPDFSIEEFTPQQLWFSEEDGPWEWKGPVIGNLNCAYGKLFQKKAGFVSMEWFPELVNYRRSIYNLKTQPKQGMERTIYNTVKEHESLLSKEIKALCGFKKKPTKRNTNPFDSWESEALKDLLNSTKPKGEGFETLITRLQMGTWLVVADFEYLYNKEGEPYGWGIARYTTPEALYGEDAINASSHRSPEESKQRLTAYLSQLLPQATHTQILKIIG